jgi:hypothetical protein
VYALHSYMTELNFMMDPPFDCPDDEVNDAAIIKATHTTAVGTPWKNSWSMGFFHCH